MVELRITAVKWASEGESWLSVERERRERHVLKREREADKSLGFAGGHSSAYFKLCSGETTMTVLPPPPLNQQSCTEPV